MGNCLKGITESSLLEPLTMSDNIDNQYERIHRKQITESIQKPSKEFIIEKIGTEGVRLGARYYKWQS